ncbi:MAG: NAD(P)/FAD-dependent oxidoreductase [Deltaproteobacteria bacterium]|nr:NAD(P)/FAD-dependent oxidoreductase [Deltaproteobacteria bacterium]
MSDEVLDALVIGAGFAGLSAAARLRQRGVERFALLEQGAGVGEFWRTNYDRIRLHSAFHDLPDDGGERARYGPLLSRDELVAYFEAYARRHGVYERARFGERVTCVAREGEAWRVEATSGVFRARTLAVATAGNRKPLVPALGGEDVFRGELLHSKHYRNPARFVGKRVLVLGSGCSGSEIALDLANGGAAHVALFIRAPRWVISVARMVALARVARLAGLAFTPAKLAESHRISRVDAGFAAEIAKRDGAMRKCALDASDIGLARPPRGPAEEMYRHARIPWFDHGTLAAIRKGRIELVNGNERPLATLTETGAQLGAREERYDAVILGTGFVPALDELIAEPARYLARRPETGLVYPITDGRCASTVDPALFFPGFDTNANGGLSLGLWGFEVADRMADVIAS